MSSAPAAVCRFKKRTGSPPADLDESKNPWTPVIGVIFQGVYQQSTLLKVKQSKFTYLCNWGTEIKFWMKGAPEYPSFHHQGYSKPSHTAFPSWLSLKTKVFIYFFCRWSDSNRHGQSPRHFKCRVSTISPQRLICHNNISFLSYLQ